ncbi:MAG: radical SAM protein [Desulfobacterales bacterium]|nr:MAG: radical SAM protein [Desulfobacterales bacterium]
MGNFAVNECTEGRPGLINRFIVELSNECNLRCRYCHQNLPDFKEHRMSASMLEKVIDFGLRHSIKQIDFTGAGETTFFAGWTSIFNRLLDQGISLIMTSNLARLFADDEIETVARLAELSVSLDTIDRKIAKDLRGVDIRNIIYNVMKIRSFGIAHNVCIPNLIVSAVFTAEAVEGIEDLVAFAAANGFRVVNLQDLVVFKEIDNNAQSVWSLEGEKGLRAVRRTRKAFEIAEREGLMIRCQEGFLDRLSQFETQCLSGASTRNRRLKPVTNGHLETYAKTPGPGETRACKDPWEFLQIIGNGFVRPCCFRSVENIIFGQLDENNSLDEIIASDTAREMRRSLLTGDLDANCRICHWRKIIPVEEFQLEMREYLAQHQNVNR